MEVECAIVDATRPDFVEIWAGMQTPIVAAQSTALELGLLPTQVVAHCIPSGGAFGRRLFWDPVQVAAQVSKRTGRICKLMYHRSDDIRHTRMRPPQVHKVRAIMLPPTLVLLARCRRRSRRRSATSATSSSSSRPWSPRRTTSASPPSCCSRSRSR
jgi:isoquinoline 1-oxidoreductase beta subunit